MDPPPSPLAEKEPQKIRHDWLDPPSTMLDDQSKKQHDYYAYFFDGPQIGFRRHNWNASTHVHTLYGRGEIWQKMKLANSLEKEGNLVEARTIYEHLTLNAPRKTRIFWQGAKFEERHGNFTGAIGHLCCLLHLLAQSKDANRLNIRYKDGILKKWNGMIDAARKWDSCMFSEINKQMAVYRSEIFSRPSSNSMDLLNVQKRRAAFLHRLIYNTLSIEGNPLGLDEIGTIMEHWHADGNEQFRLRPGIEEAHLEVSGMLALLKHLEEKQEQQAGDAAVDCLIGFEELLKMHWIMMGKVLEEGAGEWRDRNVFLDGWPYEPIGWSGVDWEMRQFCKFIRWAHLEVGAGRMHPIQLASLAHFLFTHIHPFVDGNGRIGRCLLNIVLQAFDYPPIIVPATDDKAYCDALRLGGMGNLRPFIQLISHYVQQTLAASIADKAPYPLLLPNQIPPPPSPTRSTME